MFYRVNDQRIEFQFFLIDLVLVESLTRPLYDKLSSVTLVTNTEMVVMLTFKGYNIHIIGRGVNLLMNSHVTETQIQRHYITIT